MISNSTNQQTEICPECESVIPSDAPGGVCPGCIIGLGISNHEDATVDVDSLKKNPKAFIAPKAEDLNKLFDHLEVDSLLGQGGMGAVYKARQISLDRNVALKILPPFAGSDPSFLERFQREARALARLTHAHIVMVFEFGQVSDMCYFVMEYVDGVNLREAIQAGGLNTIEALKVVPQICEALQFAHDEGIVHRDIKPENIMLDSKGRVKIADFGLAKLLEHNAGNFTLTNTNQVLGTLKYMAPEQIENPTSVDHRSDIYSLGVVFYELLTGELPLGRFDPPSMIVGANQTLDPVVMRTLEKQPSLRFQHASEVKSAVESVVVDDPTVPPQKPIKEQMKSSSVSGRPRLPVINFSLQNVFMGLGSGKGVMRIDFENSEIILDVQIKDILGGLFRSEYKEVRIHFDHILAFKAEFKWFSHNQLEIQTDYFKELATLPGVENGKIVLKFEQKDRKTAQSICDQISGILQFDEEDEDEKLPDTVTDEVVEDVISLYEKPAKLLKFAGVVDIVGSILFLFSCLGFALDSKSIDPPVFMAAFGSVICFSIGMIEIYLSRCAKTLSNWTPLYAGSITLTILWTHPGVFLLLPATIWMAFLGIKKRTQKCFAATELEQAENPRVRTDLFADKQRQYELWSKLWLSTFVLGAVGLIAFVTWFITGVIALRLDLVVFAIYSVATCFGITALIGAILLYVNPSEFWARMVARTAMMPLHLFFPITFFAGRRMLRKLDELKENDPSGNPYIGKDEGFSRV